MLGGMLAGHDECGSDIVEQDGMLKMRFYGMSSREAMEKYAGGVADYRAAEGKDVLLDIPSRSLLIALARTKNVSVTGTFTMPSTRTRL